MKTIFIATSKPGNARPGYFFSLAEAFAEDNYRVIIILDKKANITVENPSIKCYSWPNRRPTSWQDFKFITKKIKTYKPEILISSFGSVTLMNLAGKLMGVKYRINYVLSVIELFNANANKLKLGFLKLRKKNIYNLSNLIVANSKGTSNGFTKYYGLKDKNIIILPNLIEKSGVTYKNRKDREDQLLIVGNLIDLKGHKELIKQFRIVNEKHPNLKLIILGNGEEKANLINQVKNLELEDNVIFKQKVPHHLIGEFFSKSLIHISSSYHEAFGFVNIEALREGTPIISTPTEGATSIIEPEVNGEFFEHQDQNSLLKSVDKILQDWTSYSEGAKNSFEKNFSLEGKIKNHKKHLLDNL